MTSAYPTKLIGISGLFGAAAWNAIKDSYTDRGEDFWFFGTPYGEAMDRLWDTYAENGTFRDTRAALDFIISDIVPVMDLNDEAQCYKLCMALTHFEALILDRSKIAPYAGVGDFFQGFRKHALLELLEIPKTQGTVFEQYLRYPLTLPAVHGRKTAIFSLTRDADIK